MTLTVLTLMILTVALLGFITAGLRYLRTRWYRYPLGRNHMLLIFTCGWNTALFASVLLLEQHPPYRMAPWVRLVGAVASAVVAWGSAYAIAREQRRGNGGPPRRHDKTVQREPGLRKGVPN